VGVEDQADEPTCEKCCQKAPRKITSNFPPWPSVQKKQCRGQSEWWSPCVPVCPAVDVVTGEVCENSDRLPLMQLRAIRQPTDPAIPPPKDRSRVIN
jgi:hypothetical protein